MNNEIFKELKLGNIIDSNIEKEFNGKYNLYGLIQLEESVWQEIADLKEEGIECERIGNCEQEIDECKKNIIEKIKYLNKIAQQYLLKCNNKVAQSRMTCRRTGHNMIMERMPDGEILWSDYVSERELQLAPDRYKEVASMKQEEYDYEGIKELGEITEKGKHKKRRYDLYSLRYRLLWEYYDEIITACRIEGDIDQLATCAPRNIFGDFKYNFSKEVVRRDEIIRILVEIDKERGYVPGKRIEDQESGDKRVMCECGSIANACNEANTRKCEDCCKKDKRKYNYEFICSGCGSNINNMKYALVDKENKLACTKCYEA